MRGIALNARFRVHKVTGMQRYALEVSRRLADILESVDPPGGMRGPAGHAWEQLYLPMAVQGRLLWSPNNTGPLTVGHQICTIHDLIPLEHPEWFSAQFSAWYRYLLPRLTRRAAHLIAVSEYTKQRLQELLRIPESRITVIPNGVDPAFQPASPDRVERARTALGVGPGPYLLCVGSVEPRKNIGRLLEAWRMAQSRVAEDVTLVVAGGAGASRVFSEVLLGELPARVRFTGYVPDEHLAALYTGAAAFIYPSLYEGFGIPPLEAMACGVPVITSHNTSLPEVTGGAAMLVDPREPEAMAEAVVALFRNEELRRELTVKGLARAAGYSWESVARETRTLLEAHA
jgi:glycosyltransferase involved in cell wall biosynthesis